MSGSKLPCSSIENGTLRLEYLTTTGPRIVGLYLHGMEGNLLAETPDVHWETPHGEYYLRGGHRLWTAPEDPSHTCPEDGLQVFKDKDTVILRGSVDAAGLEKEIAVRLDGNRVHLLHRITWHGDSPLELAPWGVTQLRLGGMAILPLSDRGGLLPNKNLVLWPYSRLTDDRLELHDDVVLIHGRGREHAFKIGNLNSHGWIACTLGSVLFVKRFTANETGRHPDLDCNVEVYVKDVCIELETLGKLVTLSRDESVMHDETWEVSAGNFPPTLETARKINRQLSQ